MSFKKPTRRQFLVAGSSAALAAAAPTVNADSAPVATAETAPYTPEELLRPAPQRTYTGDRTTQVALPIGGIGAGTICLNGYGGLQDFSIRTRPETTAMPDNFSANSPEAAFAVLHIKGATGATKLVEGPFPPFKIFDQGLQGQGLRRGGFEGFPRFAKCEFKGEYPFGEAILSDPAIPIQMNVTGWNPFIPLDDKNSGIPCAILEYTLHNTSTHAAEYEFSYHLSHLAPGCQPDQASSINSVIPEKGVHFSNREDANAESFGSASLTVIGFQPKIKAMWLRSPGWDFDSLSALWREVSTGTFTENEGSNCVDRAGRNGGSILLEGSLAPNESRTYPILITWHFPNCYLREGLEGPKPEMTGSEGCRDVANGRPPFWRPYYAGLWQDARGVAAYVDANYSSLRSRTVAFQEALFSSTLPTYVLDAISANIGILKSPTVLRQENGNIWAWEGCFPDNGCCHGSCTHVWNYAQAMPHLFPKLERTLRSLELERSMDDRGHINFRGAIPDGPVGNRSAKIDVAAVIHRTLEFKAAQRAFKLREKVRHRLGIVPDMRARAVTAAVVREAALPRPDVSVFLAKHGGRLENTDVCGNRIEHVSRKRGGEQSFLECDRSRPQRGIVGVHICGDAASILPEAGIVGPPEGWPAIRHIAAAFGAGHFRFGAFQSFAEIAIGKVPGDENRIGARFIWGKAAFEENRSAVSSSAIDTVRAFVLSERAGRDFAPKR